MSHPACDRSQGQRKRQGGQRRALRAVPTILPHPDIMVGTAQARLCPPYGLVWPDGQITLLKNRNRIRFVKPLLKKYS